MTLKDTYKYSYSFGKRQAFNILLGIGMIGFAIFLFFRFEIDNTRIILICVFAILGLFPLLITSHYFLRSRRFDVWIETNKGLIEIDKIGKKEIFKLEDIQSLEIHEHKGLGLYEFDFDYAKYTFKNGKYFIANNFMTNEYFIPSDIEPKMFKEFLPIIWNRTNI
jgi:hypothetical protein